jgi:SAM-dependent methyltransferase
MATKQAAKPKRQAAKEAKCPDHYYEDIQGWFYFSNVYRDLVAAAPDGAVFVEVGCWKGRSTSFLGVEILKSGKKITLHCVDHFKGSDEEAHREDPDLPNLRAVFDKNMKPCVDAGLDLHVHEMDSESAALMFADESLDMVWIDAGHDYVSVRADLNAWKRKVKPGGVLGGDDWPMPGVARAVVDWLGSRFEVIEENGWKSWVKRF